MANGHFNIFLIPREKVGYLQPAFSRVKFGRLDNIPYLYDRKLKINKYKVK